MNFFYKIILLSLAITCSSCQQKNDKPATSLFNGQNLTNWKSTNFGGEGEVSIQDGQIHLGYGYPCTGITWTGQKLPTDFYAIEFDAKKLEGNDFFVGLTFPVRDDFCSLILGGWGGTTCGLSSFDYSDAANNETSMLMDFEPHKWYGIRMEVAGDTLRAFVDQQKIIETTIQGRKVHVRSEVEPSKPLGLCAFETITRYKNIRITEL